jgi:hypothetical protein
MRLELPFTNYTTELATFLLTFLLDPPLRLLPTAHVTIPSGVAKQHGCDVFPSLV